MNALLVDIYNWAKNTIYTSICVAVIILAALPFLGLWVLIFYFPETSFELLLFGIVVDILLENKKC